MRKIEEREMQGALRGVADRWARDRTKEAIALTMGGTRASGRIGRVDRQERGLRGARVSCLCVCSRRDQRQRVPCAQAARRNGEA